jgi:ABC-type Mn2+/Zn2+ transport system permease subunit
LKQERRSQIQQQLQAVGTAVMPRASRRFLDDILSDENGISFHRFQITVWTLVLVVIFGFVVYETLGMPTFDEKLLALMGISSGTYLGFKFPETK